MNRRRMLQHSAALLALGATPSLLLAAEPFQTLAKPVPQETPGKIEVLEFFHYGCPHCRNFYPLVQEWKKTLPADVAFRAVPAIWGNEQLRALARLYYTAERLDVLDKIEEPVFVAIQDERRELFDEASVKAWVGSTGVDVEAFMETYNSFAIPNLVQRADQLARAYRIQGVPTLAIGGRYLTSASMAGSHVAALQMADQLIEKARAEA